MASQFKTFTAGSVLTASELNTYLMKQAVIVCDSTADYPSSPVEGMTVYDKGADALRVYTTATTTWKAPWNLPWGRIGGASSTASTTSISSSNSDINNLSVAFTAVGNRYYKTTVQVPIYQQTTNDGFVSLSIADGSNVEQITSQRRVLTSDVATLTLVHVGTITSGSVTRKARINVTNGTGTIAYASNYPATILVEDIGPSGAPA